MSEEKKSGVSRRGFLQALGIASGAAALTPVAPGAVSKAVAKSFSLGTTGTLKIGVIMPRGAWTAESALQGMMLQLNEAGNKAGGREVQLIVEPIGTGFGSLLSKTTKLVEKDGVEVVIAYANSRAASSIHEYVKTKPVTFIEMNAGEAITSENAVAPNYFRSTLNLWQAHAAMGSWAAESLGKDAAVMSSFTNSGFDFQNAFQYGFAEAGGTVKSMRVTGAPALSDHPALAISEAAKEQASFVYASYSDAQAIGFAQAFSSAGMSMPVIGTNFAQGTREESFDTIAITGARYAGSWSKKIAYAENQKFIKNYEVFSGKSANEYAVLGYDTLGLVMLAARSSSIASGLRSAAIAGPRGEMRFDPKSQTLGTEIFLFDAVGNVQTNLDYAASMSAASHADELRSGWLNSYLD